MQASKLPRIKMCHTYTYAYCPWLIGLKVKYIYLKPFTPSSMSIIALYDGLW